MESVKWVKKMASARVSPGSTRVVDMDGERDGWGKMMRTDGPYIPISTSKSCMKIEMKQAETKATRASDSPDLLLVSFSIRQIKLAG